MSFNLLRLVVILLAALDIAPLSSARIFLAGRNYPSGEFPVAAVVQDFNNDGIADISRRQRERQKCERLPGERRRHFRSREHYSRGSRRDGNSQR